MGRLERLIGAVGVLTLGSSCRATLDEVPYKCSRDRRVSDGGVPDGGYGYPYLEGFEEDQVEGFGDEQDLRIPTLRDRCWQTHDTENAAIFAGDSDLVIRLPHTRTTWSATTRAPSLTQHIEGDFVIVTRAEPVNATFINGLMADHCHLEREDVAGLVVRSSKDSEHWLTLTVRPAEPLTDENCVDGAPEPPRAIVERKAHGLASASGGDVDARQDNVGEDGEADIAICRQGDRLETYYRVLKPDAGTIDAGSTPDTDVAASNWGQVGTGLDIEPGALEVGLTAATAAGPTTSLEAHFNWVALQVVGTAPPDGCAGVLQKFSPPSDE